MTCETVRNQLSLFLYGELSFEEEERMQQHLEGCPACRRELEREKALHRLLDAEREPLPAGLLAQCREALGKELAHSGPSSRFMVAWRRVSSFLFGLRGGLRKVARPAGALALAALGFFSGRLATFREAPAPASGPAVTQVRYVEPDSSGRVEIVLDETRRRVLRGRLDEEPIQRLLLLAARDPSDPGLRVESVDLLRSRAESNEVRQALLYAVQHDPNSGVRLKALEGLKSFVSLPETRRVLANVLLNDKDPAVRSQAIDVLVETKEQDIVGVLQQLVSREEDSYVRLRSQKALREMKASIETF